MKVLTTLCILLAVAACGGEVKKSTPSSPTPTSLTPAASVVTPDHASTTTVAFDTTTTSPVSGSGGGEKIGITDRVTIVITDPEDP